MNRFNGGKTFYGEPQEIRQARRYGKNYGLQLEMYFLKNFQICLFLNSQKESGLALEFSKLKKTPEKS